MQRPLTLAGEYAYPRREWANMAGVTGAETWLDEATIKDLRSIGARRSFPAGSSLFTEGDDPYDVLIVDSGTIKLVSTAASGAELVLDLLSEGEIVGELSAIDGGARSATAVALTDVDVVAIGGSRFLEYLDEHPAAMRSLLGLIVGRLRHANLRQLEYSNVDALGRVCHRLDEIAGDGDGEAEVDLGLTQMEFAQWCGLSREAVVKALRKLRTLGWIDQEEGRVTIHERAQLRQRGLV